MLFRAFKRRTSSEVSAVASRRFVATTWFALLGSFLLVSQAGCMLAANLMHVVGADKIPAEYDGLEGSRVAIVTVTEMGQYSADPSAKYLSAKVGEILTREIKGVSLVREDKIFEWMDQNNADATDFLAIGTGVEAEKVLGIELVNLQLRDGATLYRGRSDVSLRMIDVASGQVVFSKELEDFTFPTTTGQYTSETTERKFRNLYLRELAEQIGRSFYPYDFSVTVARDGKLASQR